MKNFEKIISEEVLDFAKDNPSNYKLITDKIRSYLRDAYPDADDYYYFQTFIKGLIKRYINLAIEEYKISKSKSLRNEIIEIADYDVDRRYDAMIALDNAEAFQKVLGYATDFLKGNGFLFDQGLYVNSQSLFALVQAYDNPKFKNTVLSFFNTAFEYAKVYAKEKIEFGKKANKDPDADTLLELVQAICSFKEADREQFADLVFEIYTFSSKQKRSYEMKQASGFMAIQLTHFQTGFDINVINDAITKTGSIIRKILL